MRHSNLLKRLINMTVTLPVLAAFASVFAPATVIVASLVDNFADSNWPAALPFHYKMSIALVLVMLVLLTAVTAIVAFVSALGFIYALFTGDGFLWRRGRRGGTIVVPGGATLYLHESSWVWGGHPMVNWNLWRVKAPPWF